MVIVRLARHGSKKRPFYQVVVADRRKARNGFFIENVGFFNPIACGKEQRLFLDVKRIEHWIKNGAQLSHKIDNLMKSDKKTYISNNILS
ncbi:30S ribosomal protein S16 [Candidatus Pantoea edessiphila]|uniref:Small ribosomal subunit protein bS16 n=1 Tax=Candidatus Pantoea edessiphila TaxID=2044610 RepID=A0A2P5SXS0_9GAMM|nr:30S ribosomal protein S16 [Candidatus Pantoea edessiphila]MBK4775668.1 30S ribosomal protein S16 [Pantoea sp. Edef]PPI87100.1 30S ribosomal protein S16 [Candidatus Pantoea edessiphila]